MERRVGVGRVTHSTKPLEHGYQLGFEQSLFLSEIEEAIHGYSVIKYADEISQNTDYDKGRWYGRIEGFNTHRGLVKDKLLLDDSNLFDFLNFAKTHSQCTDAAIISEFKEKLFQRTEWDVEFVDGKIKLL